MRETGEIEFSLANQASAIMPLETTVIGAWPKPVDNQFPDWFHQHGNIDPRKFNKALAMNSQEKEEVVMRSLREVVGTQERLGVDVITDGEVTRENYIWHFCRGLDGIDFETPKLVNYRNGATTDDSGLSRKELMEELAICVRKEIEGLIAAGCTHIQIDEPVLMREPEVALEYGIAVLCSIIRSLPSPNPTTTLHLCCGYPDYLDHEGFQTADKDNYFKMAPPLDESDFDIVAIEDCRARNNLELLSQFKKTKVALGCVGIASSRIETCEEIRERIVEALKYIPPDRLILTPDCGLGYLTSEMARKKVANMVAVAKSLP